MKKRLEADKASLALIEEETIKRLAELRHLRRMGDWLVKPDMTDLHIWELETTRQIIGWGRRDSHKYTELFLTRDLAFQGAAETVISSFEGREYVSDNKILKLYEEKKYEELVGYVSQHFSEWSFEVRSVPVKANPRRKLMCEYEEGEDDQ